MGNQLHSRWMSKFVTAQQSWHARVTVDSAVERFGTPCMSMTFETVGDGADMKSAPTRADLWRYVAVKLLFICT